MWMNESISCNKLPVCTKFAVILLLYSCSNIAKTCNAQMSWYSNPCSNTFSSECFALNINTDLGVEQFLLSFSWLYNI